MESSAKILFSEKIQMALAALDVSSIDDSVLRYLEFLSKKIGVDTIYCCHVAPGSTSFDPFFMFDTIDDIGEVWKLDQTIFDALNDQVNKIFTDRSDIKFQFEVVSGNPLDELLATAKNMDAELVIMGRKKNSESNQGVLAKNMARRVKGATLFVPEIGEPALKQILVPFDFSDNAKRALQTAINLQSKLDEATEITVLSIYDMPVGLGLDVGKSPEEVKTSFLERIQVAFKIILNDFGAANSNIVLETIETEDPAVAKIILKYASENNQDLIIMGAAGHSQVEYLLIGSITEKLLTLNDQIPVLVVK